MLLVNLHLHQIALQHLHLQSLKNTYTKRIHQKPNRVQLQYAQSAIRLQFLL